MWHWATNPQVQLVLPAMLAKSSDSVFWNLGIFWRIEDYSVGLGSDTDKESKDSGVLLASLHATLVDASLSLASHYPVMNRKARHFFKHPVVLSRILFFFQFLVAGSPTVREADFKTELLKGPFYTSFYVYEETPQLIICFDLVFHTVTWSDLSKSQTEHSFPNKTEMGAQPHDTGIWQAHTHIYMSQSHIRFVTFFGDWLLVFPRTSPGSSRPLASSNLLAHARTRMELRKWPEEAYNYQWGAMQVTWWEQWGCGGTWIVLILGWFEKKEFEMLKAAVFVFF